MSESAAPGFAPSNGQVKTFPVRLGEDVRAQLDIIAQLNDRKVTEEIRLAIEAWIEKTKSDPKTLQRADAVRVEIEREATTKRNAISAIFDGPASKAKTTSAGRAASGKEGAS